jgi:glycosyltransferase involved in cell wall biosynthesis
MTTNGTTGIHQVLVAASPGDAITNLAFAIRDLLRTLGPSEIYARHVHDDLRGDVRSLLDDYHPPHERNVLMFHGSIGQPDLHAFLLGRHEPLVLVYHNITPAKFFEPYNPAFAQLLTLGRRELAELRPRVVASIADSEYNARELRELGFDDVRVAPPLLARRDLTTVTPRASTINHLEHLDAPVLLCVAQLLPHKRPDYLVKAMHVAETYLGIRNLLLLVGAHRMDAYTNAIRAQVRELHVLVHLVGSVDDEDLAAFFRTASAFLTASEHEGFCIPLVEAMDFGVPIVARACGAVPETAGDAALLVPPHHGPALFAEAVAEVMDNTTLRTTLAESGYARRRELDAMRPEATILDSVLAVV